MTGTDAGSVRGAGAGAAGAVTGKVLGACGDAGGLYTLDPRSRVGGDRRTARDRSATPHDHDGHLLGDSGQAVDRVLLDPVALIRGAVHQPRVGVVGLGAADLERLDARERSSGPGESGSG